MIQLVLLTSSPRVAPGLLSAEAWAAVQAGPVLAIQPSASEPGGSEAGFETLRAAGVDVRPVDQGELVAALMESAGETGSAVLWVGTGDVDALATALRRTDGVSVRVIAASWDLPGARLLDVVATMDRLRSPGGCPWDAEQDHASLAPYLLEEAYEAFQTIEDGDLGALREELGDVLLQIAFHSRLAEERPAQERWSIDDVAATLVDKLVRRHPHVFAGVEVSGSDEVNANWEAIKAAERGPASALANVPMSAAALTLAATLQRKAARAGAAVAVDRSLQEALRDYNESPSSDSAGQLLWTAVAAMRAAGIDAESALRAHARGYRDSFAEFGDSAAPGRRFRNTQ